MTLNKLYQIIEDRKKNMPDGSYVTSLFESGVDRISQKVGEEAIEVVLAAKNLSKKRLVEEISDLWFHTLILMVNKKISLNDIYKEFEIRNQKKT